MKNTSIAERTFEFFVAMGFLVLAYVYWLILKDIQGAIFCILVGIYFKLGAK